MVDIADEDELGLRGEGAEEGFKEFGIDHAGFIGDKEVGVKVAAFVMDEAAGIGVVF